MTESITIPPVAKVRDKLAAAQAEVRYLRRLLPLAKQQEEAQRLRSKADQTKGDPP